MAHLRARYLERIILHEIKWSPCVSIYGMRQSGKTTLVKQLAQSYLTLDDDEVLAQFANSRWEALESQPPRSPLMKRRSSALCLIA